MMKTRRTTVSASSAALGTLEAEADRRGVPVSVLLREAVEETDGASAADLTAEPVAEEPS